MPTRAEVGAVAFDEGTDVPVVVSSEDGFLCIRVTDAAGTLFGGKVPEDADERDKRDAVYAASIFVVEFLCGRPRVEGLADSEWVHRCARVYDVLSDRAAA